MRAPGVFLILASVAGSGCVAYTPVELAALQPNEEVRVRLTDQGAVRMAQHFGRISEAVTASVEPQGADSMALTVWLGKDYPGTQFENVRQTVVLDRDEVNQLQRRRLSVWRSAAATIGVAAGFALMVDRIFLIEDPNRDDDDSGQPPPAILFLLFRIPSG